MTKRTPQQRADFPHTFIVNKRFLESLQNWMLLANIPNIVEGVGYEGFEDCADIYFSREQEMFDALKYYRGLVTGSVGLIETRVNFFLKS